MTVKVNSLGQKQGQLDTYMTPT